ncbi:hypothetical protein BLA18112_03267 [Burkholderia lata]|uniref:Uncharacterized protein n=1 Tax=Burkholderia lata (strain ATCC 17760 / DSM 23089 / LMG 22485 / NCIMB 9086 / R18194 / 383) TaxID=482957 RepID=A0A6P2W3K1_BURL3|nr:hypothetical protein [Burkholderia lata]VWC90290.1 hypothetical protein BLA18112_03267 [Burkholderia lata]
MRRILLFGLSIFGFMIFVCSATAKEPERVLRDDCHLSFSIPNGLKYVDVGRTITLGKDECYIPFLYTGKLRLKRTGPIPRMSDDWRALTDFALTVEAIPVADSLEQIESVDGAAQNGLFKVISKEHVQLSGGDLYVISYSAIKPTGIIIGYQNQQRVFVAGNGDCSTVLRLYYGDRTSRVGKEREHALKYLFSLFRLFLFIA